MHPCLRSLKDLFTIFKHSLSQKRMHETCVHLHLEGLPVEIGQVRAADGVLVLLRQVCIRLRLKRWHLFLLMGIEGKHLLTLLCVEWLVIGTAQLWTDSSGLVGFGAAQ